jgi:hypothetical protein
MNNFYLGHIFKSIIFKVKNTFESNVFKLVIKTIFVSSNPFAFLIINVKILSNVQKESCTFNREKTFGKKKIVHIWGLTVLNM